jgi:beta-lactamase regulating signal transducer with metallopeptidase domain
MDRAIVEYLANALWQVPLLVSAVAALLWALGSDVRTRHRVWLAVLAAALLLPLRGMETAGSPEERIIVVTPAAAPVRTDAAVSAEAADIPVTRIVAHKAKHQAGLVIGPAATRWIVRLYCALLAFAAWRILRAWIAAQGLLRRSHSIDLAPRAMAIFAQAADRQSAALPRLRQSDETVSPVVIGAWRPVLLLPAGFDRLKEDEIRGALSHEFAHLARRDYLVNLLCQIFALPLAWHPAIHYVQKRIRDTREMLCDAVAAEEMASPVRYATCLVAFALRALDGGDSALATQGLSMFDNRILEERIARLTQAPERPAPSTRLARLAGASLGLVLALAMALLFHVTPTWADTPVQLTPPPQVDLPAIPASPAAPATPAAPAAPPVPAAPAQPRQVHNHLDDDTRRAIAEESRERAREQVRQQREQAQQQREEAQRQREQAQEQAERSREQAQEAAEEKREAAEEQRDSAREQMEEARREAVEASRAYAAEIKRQLAEAAKAGREQDVDMDKIKQEVAKATAIVHSPDFQAQMAELQAHMQQLHDNMAELREHMKDLDHEIEKSVNAPM